MRFAIVNLGCKVNRVESDSFAAILLAAGAECVTPNEADLIIVNTCTVTGEAEKKTRKAVRRSLKASETAHVIVTGCAAAIDPEVFEAMDSRVEVVSKGALNGILLERYASEASENTSELIRVGDEFPTRVGIKVQDGCNHACTYCIVHTARGRSVSMPFNSIVDEACRHAASGAREIVLTGINLGSYSWEGKDLVDLLTELLAATESYENEHGPVRFRVGSVEPMDVHEEFIRLMARAGGRICRHLHLPLQAGSSKVLREMARPYTADDFASLVERMYRIVPELSLSTDIICGFPGETEEEFQETLDMAQHCRFSKIHVFPYSKRNGTPAAARTDQVDPEIKAKRTARLMTLEQDLAREDYAKRAGTEEWVLVESASTATTESYHEVCPPEGAVAGSLVRMVLPPVVL